MGRAHAAAAHHCDLRWLMMVAIRVGTIASAPETVVSARSGLKSAAA